MIIEKKKSMTTVLPSTHRPCLFGNLIGNQSKGESSLTHKDLLSNVKVFFLAGSDTTSATLSWCFYHLCVDKILKKALQKEVDEVLSLNTTGAEAIKAIPNLPLCAAYFKESLRLKPAADMLFFEPVEKAVTLSNGIVINPGDAVFVNLQIIMLDPTVFSEPLEFQPSRWLETSNTPKKLAEMNASFTPFGYGPRVCPGQVRLSMHINIRKCIYRKIN
jgi:cytochrome P450